MAKILPDDVDASLSFLEANPRAAKPLDKIPAAPIIRKGITQQKAGIPDDVEASLARLEGKPVPEFAQPTERGLTQREIEADVLGLAIRKGIKSDTALAAHRRDVAAKTGVNPGLVTPQVEDTAFYKEHDPEDLIKNFPAVAKYLGVQGNAELVGKDIGHLKTLETFFRRAVQDPEIVAAKGAVALAQSAVGIVDLNPFFLGALGKKLEEKGIDFPKISKTLTELYTPEMQAALGEVQNAKGFWGTLQAAAQNPSAVGEMVGVSLPSMYLGSIYARAMMPLLPAAAAIPIGEGLTMAGSAAEQIRTQSPDKELDAKGAWLSWGTGLVGTAVGAFGMKFSQRIGIEDPDVLLATGKLSDAVIGKMQQSKVPLSLATRLSAGFVSEGIVEELPQGVTEQIFQNIALGKQWDEGVPEAAALSIVTGGAMGAAVQAGVTTGRQGTAKDDPLRKATDAHLNDIGKAVSAEEQQAALQKWSEEIVNNKLRKESPSAFKEFVKTMADEHSGIKEVFIDAKHLEESLQQSGIKPEEFVKNMPEVARDLQTALATSGEVRIPIEDYATYLAGSKLEPMILNELRTDPEGMTYSESQTFFQQQKEIFAEKAKEIINTTQPVLSREEFAAKPQNDGKDYTEYLKAHENKVEVFARDAQEVHDKILTGMNSAKRFNRAVNAVYAVPFREFYAVNAAKEGILPSELYARLPLNFSKMQIEDGGLEQEDVSTLSQQEVERRLVAQHNISVNNLVHADRMGGLAAPSLAITDKDNVFSSFGDITLLSSKEMVDPKSGAKVFGADIYSPRYPRVDYSFSKESVKRLNVDLKDALEATNDTPFETYALDGDQSNVESTLKENAAVLYSFLQDRKVKPKLVKTKKSVLPKWALKYADKPRYAYVDSPEYLKDVENAPEYAVVFDHVKDDSPEEKARMVRNLANSKAYTIDAYRTDKPNFGKIDPKGSLQEMTSQLYAKGLQQEYDAHLYSLALSLNPVEKIFKGFSPSGNRKYVPHNVENVIKEMKTEIRGGEGSLWGMGAVRSRYTPQFKSVEQIRKADNRLLSTDAFEEVKKEVEQEYMSLLEEVRQYYKHKSSTSFGLDSENAVLHDAAKLGIPRALRENQYENVPQETQERIRDFLSKLADMPTEYFEVKLLRRVGLNEFSGAVVPKNVGQQVIDILKKNGVKDIKFYKPQDNKDRLAKINEFSDLFFQKTRTGRDADYLKAVADGDMVRAQEMVYEAAKDKGYISGSEYRMMHQAPNREDYNLATIKDAGIVPDDYWTHPHYYQNDATERNSFYTVKKAIESKSQKMWVYRSVPKDVKDTFIRNGDWVSPSREYAKLEGEGIPGGYRIIAQRVSLKDVWWDANSINELGYDDGKEYAYKNTKNNRKLLDAVTYDVEGNAVPLSKRFNSRAYDTFFQTAKLPETVNVDGVERTTLNSEGRPIYPTEEGIRNFWRWFRDSKVVDEQGRPLARYKAMHPYDWTKETDNSPGPLIDEINRSTPFPAFNHGEPGVKIAGFFGDKQTANMFVPGSANSAIYPVYLNLNKPFIMDAKGELAGKTQFGQEGLKFREAIRSGKYDSVIILNTRDEGDLYVTLVPNQSKSAIGNNGDFSSDPNILKQSAFYSALEREVPNLRKVAGKEGNIKPEQAKAWIEARQKEGKFKKEEIEAVGLMDWLDTQEGKVPVADIENFVRENGVRIDETVLGGTVLPIAVQEYEDQPEIYTLYRADDPEGQNYGSLGEIIKTAEDEYEINVPDFTGRIHYATLKEALERVSRGSSQFSETKFDNYVLPGGENYRELLLTLPGNGSKEFTSAHFDQPNILAHVRVNERTANGQKVLFVEEIQSDWAQQGRDKGFASLTPQEQEELRALDGKAKELGDKVYTVSVSKRTTIEAELLTVNKRRAELREKVRGSTPTGPFVQNTKSWTALAVKRLMRYAAENGFDKIAWTTGEQQAARYDLSKQIAAVNYVHYPESDSYGLHFETIGSDRGIADRTVKSGELSDFVGKELAEKIVKGEGSARKTELDNGDVITTKRLSGLDLKIGGEGMKAFYDQIVPQVVNDVSKKLGGGKTGRISINSKQAVKIEREFMDWAKINQPGIPENVLRRMWQKGDADETVRKFKNENRMEGQHSIDITPEMRDKIMQGLPLFQGNRAGFNPNTFTMTLLDGSDLSSVIHEGGHFYLEALNEMATRPEAPQQIKDDFRKTLEWFGITGNEVGMPGGETLAQESVLPETVNVDGVERTTLNSEGRPIYPTEEGIRNFWKWFGDSKVVDGQGRPKVVYHGTSADFTTFEQSDNGVYGKGVYLSEFSGDAQVHGTKLMALYVRIATPRVTSRAEAKKIIAQSGGTSKWNKSLREEGYDGIYAEDTGFYIPFSSVQIKSTIGNNGDFSSDPSILKQGGETPQPGQLPPGRTPEEIWNSMTLDQKRPYHEQWAQSWERYALEGKAPTLEMQPVFARFRAWMLNIYKSMKEFLRNNPLAGKLNDDIRAVFDRLIASDEAIAEAQKARSYAPLFATSEEAGVTDKQFQEYVDEGRRSADEATSELDARSIRDMKWLTGARTRALKSLQAEARTKRKMMRTEVEQDIAQEPVERAKSYFAKGEYVNDNGEVIEAEVKAKLNKADVRELMPNIDMQKLRGMTSDDGIALDLAAQLTGFSSGDALLKALNDSEPTRDKVAAEVDKRMLEQYGDLVDDNALSAAADEAVHNEARARFMATGLKMLLKTSATSSQLVKAAKQAAEQAIAGKPIRDIRPGQYARAETKANKEALKRAPKDRAGAAEAQRAALLNNKLYSVARDAQNEVNSILKYVRKFDDRKLGKVIHHDYLEQIVDLLSPFEFKNLPLRQIDKNKSLTAWIEEQEANGFQPAIDVDTIEKSKLKNYKDMTLEELRGLKDTIKQIEHLGRYKDKLLTAKDRREFNERMLEAEDSLRENANRTVEERATPTDTLGKTGQWFRQMTAGHRKFSSIIREMDGGKDNGTMWNLLARAMNEAGDMETEMRQQAAEKVATLFKMIELDQGFMNLSAKKRLVPGTDISMTHEQRIMFAMNWGNEGNRQRLLDGGITGRRALSMPQAQSILDTLTKPEWDFVQATWDYVGTYKEQIAALERKMTGVEPLWIEPAPIETKFGTYPGGYFPAKYDAELSTRSESLEAVTDLRMGMKGAFGAAATRNGYTQERSKQVIGRPLLLSFNVIPQHVNEVIHRLSWQPWLTDANRVLRHLDSPIREHYGTEILREMRDTVMDIATGDAPAKNATEAAINRLRMGSTIVGMGWRVTTALLQPSGLAQSYVRVGPKWVSQGILQFLTSPNDSAEFADSRSTFMKNRATTMNREINEVLNTLRTGEGVSNLTASYFWLIAKMQRTVDIPTWIGAYNKGLAEVGYENAVDEAQRKTMEEHAVRLADQAVIDSQSSGMTKDLARVQRGSPLNKILTNFYSYFSATYNLNIETVRKTNFMKPAEVMLMANNLIVLNVIPVLFAVALKESIKGNCGDDLECLAGKLANEQISYMLGQMILLREIGAAVGVATGGDQYGYQGPAGLRFFGDLYKAGVQVNQGEADMPMFKNLNNVAGAVLHYPAGQINNTVEGIIAVENGDVEGASILPALLFGPPKD